MSNPSQISTQKTLDRLVDECHGIMANASAARRDMTDAELNQVRIKAAEFDRIRDKARYAGPVKTRAELRERLRNIGLPRSAAERVASVGWPALSPQNAAADAVDRICAAEAKLRST